MTVHRFWRSAGDYLDGKPSDLIPDGDPIDEKDCGCKEKPKCRCACHLGRSQ